MYSKKMVHISNAKRKGKDGDNNSIPMQMAKSTNLVGKESWKWILLLEPRTE